MIPGEATDKLFSGMAFFMRYLFTAEIPKSTKGIAADK
jgi:hypothetical protein